MSSSFDYMCEWCLDPVRLTDRQLDETRGPDGLPRVLCGHCDKGWARTRATGRQAGYNRNRDAGCIVTWRTEDGEEHTRHAPGLVQDALRQIVVGVAPGSEVLSISTPNSVLRDMQGARYYGGDRCYPRVDAWQVERTLLGKVRRLDLLPERARGA